MKKIVVSSIDWHKEGYEGTDDLPVEVEIGGPDPELLEDIDGEAANLAEYLTQKYGCLVNGFVVEVEGVEP